MAIGKSGVCRRHIADAQLADERCELADMHEATQKQSIELGAALIEIDRLRAENAKQAETIAKLRDAAQQVIKDWKNGDGIDVTFAVKELREALKEST